MCLIVGVVTLIVLPLLVLGAAWQKYRLEEAALHPHAEAPVRPAK